MPRSWIADRHGGRVELSTCYGQTECAGAVTFTRPGASVDDLARTVGHPASPGLVRLRDGAVVSTAPGAVGEVEIAGPLLAAGYFGDEAATRDMTTEDGWLRTGDLARVCDDGALELVGRLREMFKSGGYNVYPREVELALESHPSVTTAAVVAVPDDRYQEVGHAFVVTRTATPAVELEAHARLSLAGYKVPRAVHVRTELPLLSNGKVDKELLRSQATRPPMPQEHP
jgi:long-chain acyl-CoA synthetase